MSLLRHRRERLALRAEIDVLRGHLDSEVEKVRYWSERCARLRAERDQAEAELRALRGEVA
jgi:uncharacterized coiled-coil DUF342 family protein